MHSSDRVTYTQKQVHLFITNKRHNSFPWLEVPRECKPLGLPLLPLELFRQATRVASRVDASMISFVLSSNWFCLPLSFQNLQNLKVLASREVSVTELY